MLKSRNSVKKKSHVVFLGHEKSVTWSGCEFEDVESWFYRVRRLIYWNMFGMTRILLKATAPSVRGWEILFDYTHMKKKRYAIASELSKFSHLSLTVDYIRLLQGSYMYNTSCPYPPKLLDEYLYIPSFWTKTWQQN